MKKLVCHHRQQLRVVGSALSPNGLGLSTEGTLSMALMDRVLKVDPEKKQVGGVALLGSVCG